MRILKTIAKVIGILLVAAIVTVIITGICVYSFVLQYPTLKENPKVGKWYRVTDSAMKDSEENEYHKELLKTCRLYREIAELQLGEEAVQREIQCN